jgi:hypothetical protein
LQVPTGSLWGFQLSAVVGQLRTNVNGVHDINLFTRKIYEQGIKNIFDNTRIEKEAGTGTPNFSGFTTYLSRPTCFANKSPYV